MGFAIFITLYLPNRENFYSPVKYFRRPRDLEQLANASGFRYCKRALFKQVYCDDGFHDVIDVYPLKEFKFYLTSREPVRNVIRHETNNTILVMYDTTVWISTILGLRLLMTSIKVISPGIGLPWFEMRSRHKNYLYRNKKGIELSSNKEFAKKFFLSGASAMQNVDGPVLDKLFNQDLVDYLDNNYSLDIAGHKSSMTISTYRAVIHPEEVQTAFNRSLEILYLFKQSTA